MNQPQPTALEHARAQWHEVNARIGVAANHGNPPDTHRFAALLDARAGWWDQLGGLADRVYSGTSSEVRDVYAVACSYAGILDRQDAARIRFRYRIPTLHPSSQAELIRLNDSRCGACGRPWLLDPAGACPECPAVLYGITPMNADEAATYPPGRPWAPGHTLGQEHISTARYERRGGEHGDPLTETEWTALREFAWSPIYEPPAGTPERYRHEALRTALGEAERLAGRARSNRSSPEELAEILAAHRVMVVVDNHGQTPKLYNDLLEWGAVAVEREISRLHERGFNQLPDKVPARTKPEANDVEDGRFPLRKRTIPEQLRYFADKLGNISGPELPPDAFTLLAVASIRLGAIANELHGYTEAVELLGRLVDHEDTACNLDDCGYCLEHHMPDPCQVPAARALLARIRSEQPGGGQ